MPRDNKAAEYRVVTADNKVERLIKEVNKLIDVGWEPLGGVSVSHAYDVEDERITVLYAQAVIRSP
jgi:Domain of unknown function (DUF1737)